MLYSISSWDASNSFCDAVPSRQGQETEHGKAQIPEAVIMHQNLKDGV